MVDSGVMVDRMILSGGQWCNGRLDDTTGSILQEKTS